MLPFEEKYLYLPTYTGTQFNRKYSGIKLVKLTDYNESFCGLQFHTGIIRDPREIGAYSSDYGRTGGFIFIV